jgi:hypothetical protein
MYTAKYVIVEGSALPNPEEIFKSMSFQETYRTGWKLISWRFGQSQNWARVRHPEGL